MAGLSAIEIVALSKCIKDKEVTEARAKIPEASAHPVNFTVHVLGNLTRAGGVAAQTVEVAESVSPGNLRSFEHCCAVLRALGIGAKRLETALRATELRPVADEEFAAVFARIESERSEVVPARQIVTPARSGNISVNVSLARV